MVAQLVEQLIRNQQVRRFKPCPWLQKIYLASNDFGSRFFLVQPLVQPFEKIRYSFIKNEGSIYALNCINRIVLNWKNNEKNFIVVLRSFELRQEEVLLS